MLLTVPDAGIRESKNFVVELLFMAGLISDFL